MTTEVANCHTVERRIDEPAKSFLAWLRLRKARFRFWLKVARSNAETQQSFTASTALLEKKAQVPSPSPDLIPASTVKKGQVTANSIR